MTMLLRIGLIVLGLIPIGAALGASFETRTAADHKRTLYAVNQAPDRRGSISVYDIDAEHRVIKTIPTVPGIADVKGVAASAATGKLYVAYRDRSGTGHIFCLDVYGDKILWDRRVDPGVDRLAIDPDGQLLYVPTGEHTPADFIQVVDANTGNVLQKVNFSNRSHDTQYPLSGPLFQETKATDGSGHYLYAIDPRSYAVSRLGPFAGILGPFAVDSASRYVVTNVIGLWGMQVADLKTGKIITVTPPSHPTIDPGLLHAIGWTPDETEVWQAGAEGEVYVWDMQNPLSPSFKQLLKLRSSHGPHWLTFSIRGDFAYIAPDKNSRDKTEIFSVVTHLPVGTIESTEDMLEIDFSDGKTSQIGDQFGIGRRPRPF